MQLIGMSAEGMGVSPRLLEALYLTEVKASAEFEQLTLLRAPASDEGSTLYALRKPNRTEQAGGERLTLFGNTRVGRLQLSYIYDRLGTRIDIQHHHPLGLCIMVVLGGMMRFRLAGQRVVHMGRAGDVLVCQLAPGAQALTADGTAPLNLFIDADALHRRPEAMVERRLVKPAAFAPCQSWAPGVAASLARLVRHVSAELSDTYSMFAGGLGVAEFEGLVIRTLLEGVPHSYTDRLTAAQIRNPAQRRRARDGLHAREHVAAAHGPRDRDGGGVLEPGACGRIPRPTRAIDRLVSA